MNKTTEWWEKIIDDLLMLTPENYRESIKRKIESGSVISASIAYAGTYALQEAAIGYYIYGKSIDEAKKMYQNSKQEKEKS